MTGVTEAGRHVTVVFVHGAWHDETAWDLVIPPLRSVGAASVALTLPSIDPGPGLPGIAADVAAVTDLIDTLATPVVLVGHSYGGMVISAAGHHQRVRHLVYLAAFCPIEGECVLDLAIGEPPPLTAQALRSHDDGTMSIDPQLAADTFYADLDPAKAADRVGRLRRSTTAVFTTPAIAPAWTTVPTTSVVCTQDRAISVDRVEQMAARADGSIHRWPTSHSPFLSSPTRVADLLADIADSL